MDGVPARKMRVGLLVYGDLQHPKEAALEQVSGGFLYDRRLVERLRKSGVEVEVISIPWRGYLRSLLDNYSLTLTRRLLRLEVDVLLQDELNHPSLYRLNKRLQKKAKYPVFSIVHHLRSSEQREAWKNRFYRHVERQYLESVSGFIYNSETTRRTVEGVLGYSKPCVTAHPGRDAIPQMDLEIAAQRAFEPGPLRTVFVGNVIPRKGLITLLEALTHLHSYTHTLQVVGNLKADPSYTREVRRFINAHNLREMVTLRGRLSHLKLHDTLKASQVLAVPSSYEGFGIVYLEGMAYGLPAVATQAGAASEIITHGENGCLIPVGAAADLASYLLDLHADRERLARMSAAALVRYAGHPTWDETMGKVCEFLYSSVIGYT